MPGDEPFMPAEDEPQTVVEAPSPAERRAFHLLPLVWIVVLILAGIILYAVFS
jgi:hypothetical protein